MKRLVYYNMGVERYLLWRSFGDKSLYGFVGAGLGLYIGFRVVKAISYGRFLKTENLKNSRTSKSDMNFSYDNLIMTRIFHIVSGQQVVTDITQQ